jgi:hypothetical protein
MGFSNPDNLHRLTIPQMRQAESVLPLHRQRKFAQLVGVRQQLVKYIKALQNAKVAPAKTEAAPAPATPSGPPPGPPKTAPAPTLDTPPPRGTMQSRPVPIAPPSVIYRQPDGEENGKPKGHVYLKDSEWMALAIEIAYKTPAFLDTLHGIRPADVFHAQRVLPSNRRRIRESLTKKNFLPHLAPTFSKLRAAVTATRAEITATQEAAQADEIKQLAERTAEATRAAQEAAQAAMRADLLTSPDFIKQALATVGVGALFDAFAVRLAASAQGMIEAAIINAMSSDKVKNALVVNVYSDRPAPAPAREPSAPAALPLPTSASRAAEVLHPPIMGEARPVAKARKIIIGVLGMKSVQAQELQREFPQFEILHQENVTTKAVQEMHSAAKVIGSRFMTHAPEPTIIKHFGDKYCRLHGGISMIKRQIRIWIAAGVFGADAQGATA